MSRWAKRWITAVFVLLIAGLLVYIGLAWSPEEPFSFRVMDPATAASANPSLHQEVMVEVENTTSFPLLFLGAEVGPEDMRIFTLGDIRMHVQAPSLLNADGTGIRLRGGQRILMVANMNPNWHRNAADQGARVRYHWCSALEYWVTMRLVKPAMYLPDWLQGYVPFPEPSSDTAPLDPFARVHGP
jgi:hypothetical protein